MFVQKTFKNNLPTIYMVGTPIGNLSDMSIRSIEILKSVDFIYCEDTRTSLILLSKYEIKSRLISLHKYNEVMRVDDVCEKIRKGSNIAIISDAGVPGISDPGSKLTSMVFAKMEGQFNITAVNAGPAYIHAIAASGFDCYSNYFVGFLEKKEKAQTEQILKLINDFSEKDTLICIYESVHRIKKTISNLEELIEKDTKILIAREITKLNEEFIRGTIKEVKDFIYTEEMIDKGEFCLILDKNIKLGNSKVLTIGEAVLLVEQLKKQGKKTKIAVLEISKKHNINKTELYDKFNK